MNKKTLSVVNPILYLFDFFVGLHLMVGLWGDILLNGTIALLLPALAITAGLIALNVFVYRLNRKVKLQASQPTA